MDIYIPTEDGRFVSQKFQDLAEILRDHDPYLELRWIPPEHRRDIKDKTEAWAVVDLHPSQREYIVLYAGEDVEPYEILARIWAGDSTKNDVLSLIDIHNDARKAMEDYRWRESMAEAAELSEFMVTSPLNYMKINGIKFDDQRRRVE